MKAISIILFTFAAATALSAPDSKALAKAYTALDSPSFKARVDAVALLAASGDPGARDAITRKLKDSDATVRWAACEALEKLADPRSIPPLEEAAKDPSPLVANRAQEALGKLLKRSKPEGSGTVVELRAQDNSKSGVDGLTAVAEQAVARPVQKVSNVTLGKDGAAYAVTVTVQTIKEHSEGNDSVLEAYCSATVMELPGRQLRFASRVGAAAARPGKLTPEDKKALSEDAVSSAAGALGDEVAEYLTKR